MAEDSVDQMVIDIVAERLGHEKDEIKAGSNFINDLGADSLDIVELVMEFEEKFDMTIPEEDAEKIQTVGDAVSYVKEHK